MRLRLTEDDYVRLSAWGARGLRLEDAAARLGTSRRTLGRALTEDHRAAEAWALGRAELHEELVSKLIEKAKGGDTVSLLFSLKTLFGYREGEPLDGGEQRSLVTINVPAALPPDAYAKLIEVKPRELDAAAEGSNDA
jgi:predicted DNA-binding protein (UPF0251 family)